MQLNDITLLQTQCFVNGAFVGGGVDAILNPATGETLGKVPRFGAPEAEAAIEAAHAAMPAWAGLTAKERAAMLRRWFDLIIKNREDIARILTSEQGKPLAEALGEVDYAASFVEFYAEEAKRVCGAVLPSHRADARIVVLRQPIGVVCAITPWNFPAAMITRKLSPAMAAGCACVVKPAPETPLTALALAELARRAGLPAGVFNVITGDAPAIGKVMCTHEAVRFVGFTGSTEVGRLLMAQAAPGVKKMALELGGNAPFIVFEDADLDKAAAGALMSKFRNMGQTCVCANRIYAQESVYDAFVQKLKTAMAGLTVGNGLEAGITQGPLITQEAVAKVEAHVADAITKGGRLLIGGKRHALGGTYFEPTLIAGANASMRLAHEETFGPVAAVFPFKDEKDIIAQANDTIYGLAAYFYARDLGRVWRVAEALEYGMVGVNTGLVATELAPFGGVKQSGFGREGSKFGLEEFTEIKYILMADLKG